MDKFVALAQEVNASSPAKQEELSEQLLRQFANSAAGDLCCMHAVIGGITAQEVMKVRNYTLRYTGRDRNGRWP